MNARRRSDAIRAWADEHGRPPRYREWTPSRSTRPVGGREPPLAEREAESPRRPSATVVCDLYRDRPDPWNAALADAAWPMRWISPTGPRAR